MHVDRRCDAHSANYLLAIYDPDNPEDTRTLKEFRAGVRDSHAAKRWWEPYWPRPEMRQRIESTERFIVRADS